jgi:carbamoylphosphate synthase large subunit
MAGVMEFQCSKHLNTSHLPSVTEHVMSEVYSEEVLHATFIQNKQIEISSVMRAINDKHTHHVHMQTLPHTHTHTHTHTRARARLATFMHTHKYMECCQFYWLS